MATLDRAVRLVRESGLVFSSLLFSSLLASARAQASVTGVWLPGFNHDVNAPNATDYLAPFRTPTGFLPNFLFGKPQLPGLPTPFNWGWPAPLGTFNAIHMSLIPKGPLQGHLLVWNRYAVVLRPGTPLDGTNFWAFQAYSIINPDPNAPAPRFRNFLLPLLNLGPNQPSDGVPQLTADLFCSGHAWSPFGDLFVAGGSTFLFHVTPTPNIQELGAKFLYLFDPVVSTAPFPGQVAPLYAGELGRWRKPPAPSFELAVDRYYPTVMLTHQLSRTGLVATMIVAGGQDPFNFSTLPGGNDPRNTYESFWVRSTLSPTNYLQQDPWPLGSGQLVFRGPGTSNSPYRDWFEQYPRLHLLSTGRPFLSGWAPLGASVDAESPPLALGGWDSTIGATGSAWNLERIDGSSVFFARRGPLQDLVVRLCGKTTSNNVTRTAEFCFASTPAATWNALPDVPDESTGNGRAHSSAVILPDGSILVLGGDDPAYGPILTMAIYKLGIGWKAPFGNNGTPTVRDYHATMVLLPDGRVFVGGGESRHIVSASTPTPHDYDIYEPAYLHSTQPRPTAVALPGIAQDPDGTYELANDLQQVRIVCELSASDLAYLDKVVLIAPGSITHHSDMSSRYIELQSVAVNSSERQFDTPGETVAPRGYYMLFALSDAGIPAEAVWVRIR